MDPRANEGRSPLPLRSHSRNKVMRPRMSVSRQLGASSCNPRAGMASRTAFGITARDRDVNTPDPASRGDGREKVRETGLNFEIQLHGLRKRPFLFGSKEEEDRVIGEGMEVFPVLHLRAISLGDHLHVLSDADVQSLLPCSVARTGHRSHDTHSCSQLHHAGVND